MKQTVFIFGRTPKLSLLELQTFYPEAREKIAGIGEVASLVDAGSLIQKLGGTVKIVDIVSEVTEVNEDTLVKLLVSTANVHKITFGISAYGTFVVPATYAVNVKKKLIEQGFAARYVESKHERALSSVVVAKQQVIEVVIIGDRSTKLMGITKAVQDFEDWNLRDFGRPYADPKAGMLPPKVARMIVNIALGGKNRDHHPMVLDPFCGVGTIVAEALFSGANAMGSDLSEEAVLHAKKNIEWLRSHYPQIQPLYSTLFVSDATHVTEHMAPQSVDAIVTEPFMGETIGKKARETLTGAHVKNILKGLEKLYIGALREWQSVLTPDARVVMAMPGYVVGHGVMRVKNVVDRCESLGYTLLTGPIEYSRPQAVVRREFYVFQKK